MIKKMFITITFLMIGVLSFSEDFIDFKNITVIRKVEDKVVIDDNTVRKAIQSCEQYLKNNSSNSEIIELYNNSDKSCVQLYQYDESEKKILYMNFLPIRYMKEKRFNEAIIFILDGGSDYWQIKYDIDKDFCYNLTINGEA